MKWLIPVIIAPLLYISCSSEKTCPETQEISLGEFKNNWEYSNKEWGIGLQLPQDWHMVTYKSHYAYPIAMNQAMPPDLIMNNKITLKDILNTRKGGKEPFGIMPVFFICENNFEVTGGSNRNINKGASITFSVAPSAHQNDKKDLQQLIDMFQQKSKGSPIKTGETELSIGHAGILKGMYVSIPTGNGTLIRLTGIRNYGCYNLFISIDYTTDQQFEKIKEILSHIRQ